MTEAAYADWLARGRRHQQEKRPLDAIQCYRRALREASMPEAGFHLGEAFWQLGRLDEALRAWEEVTRAHPAFLPALQARAEAALGLGDAAAAINAARAVLEQAPRHLHSRTVCAIAEYADPAAREHARTALIEVLDRDAGLLRSPALAGSLAVALEATRDETLVAELARHREALGARVHPRLVALVCEQLAADGRDDAGWFATLLGQPLAVDEHDALRRVARAATALGSASAGALVDTYCALCASAFASAVPVLWPDRTAGSRPRVIIAAVPQSAAEASRLAVALATTCEVWWATLESGDVAVPAGVTPFPLGAAPAAAEARALAALDPDLLVDAIGLDGPIAPLLAQRPARRIASLRGRAGALRPPVVDEALDPAEVRAGFDIAQDGREPDRDTLEREWRAAVAAHQAGQRSEAAAGYARVLAWQPRFAPAHHLSGVLAREAGDLAAARAAFAAALALAPAYHDARAAAIGAAAAARDADAVAELTRAIPATAPATLWRAAGHAWLTLHDGTRAAECFAAALQREPSDAETHYNVGVGLQMARAYDDAARAYQRALTCRPDLVAADFNLGVLFTETGNRDAAIAAFSTVLRAKPAHVAAHKNLCEALLAAGRIDAWLAAFRRFEAQCPDALAMAVQALEACHYAADFAGVERYLEGLRQERFVAESETDLADALEQLLYLLLYFDVEPSLLLRFAETYDRTAAHVYGAPLPRRGARAGGRLRVGYLSADLRNHVMGKMMYQAISRHDRSRFDVRLYALAPQRDEWTDRFAATADALVFLHGMDDAAAVARIAQDDLDLLVDLNTHTRGARPGILARKPARVQVTHVASAGALGLRAIDFKLTDRFADVAENAAFQLEPLLAMEGCVYPYRHIEPDPGARLSRAALGLRHDAWVLGAFVNPLKLSRRCLTLWREVLARVPRAVLAFSPLDAGLREVYLRLCGAMGIDTARVVFVPASADERVNQARYAIVDAVLDPMPFGGVNGTLEALDAGVPVVTLLGKRHGERTSYSILANLGVTSTVAATGRDYVDLAVRLADDAAFAAEVRAAIRAGLARSALVDMESHARHLEAAYEEALATAVLEPTPAP